MVTWNFKSLKSRIQEQVSDTEYKRLDQYMNAFDWKGKAVEFHLNEAYACFEQFSDCSLDGYMPERPSALARERRYDTWAPF